MKIHSFSTSFLALLAISWLSCLSLHASDQEVNPQKPALLPLPHSVEWGNNATPLISVKLVVPKFSNEPRKSAQLRKDLKLLFSSNKLTYSSDAKQRIILKLGKVNSPNQWEGQREEAYKIIAETRGAVITANTLKGLNLGVQTLDQLIVHADGKTTLATCKIIDFPVSRKRQAPVKIEPKHGGDTPKDRLNVGWWKKRHLQKLEEAKAAKCDILFVGDSITQLWESRSGSLWKDKYLSSNSFNIGYSADQTSHVLWRIENGEMSNFRPKVAVLMVGTNNAEHQKGGSPRQTADGVRAIINRIHRVSPETKVLLLAVFPRGANADDQWRRVNDKVNTFISKYHDGDMVHYLDLSSAFLDKKGNLSKSIMPDLLHPNAKGYELWSKAMEPKLKELLESSNAPGAASNSAVIPVSKLEDDFYDWHERHNAVVDLVKTKGSVDLVFIGDSITHMFGGQPKSSIARGVPTWEKYYGRRKVINMGFGWDRTQNMLWRLENGAFDGITPKVAVILAGTNNLTGTKNAPTNTPEEIAAGVKAICDTIHQKSPKTKILLLSVLPRHGAELNEKIKEINKILPSLAKQEHVAFVNMWAKFASKDGQQNMTYFQDRAHPNAAGYRLWAETLEPILKKILK